MDEDTKLLTELSCKIFGSYEFLLKEYAKGEATETEKCNLECLAEILNRDIEEDSKTYITYVHNNVKVDLFNWKTMIDKLKYN